MHQLQQIAIQINQQDWFAIPLLTYLAQLPPMDGMNQQGATITKIDHCFNQSRREAIRRTLTLSILPTLQAVALISVAAWAFPKNIDKVYSSAIYTGIALNVVQLVLSLTKIIHMTSLDSALQIAQSIGHARQQSILLVEDYDTIDSRLSDIYDFSSPAEGYEQQQLNKLCEIVQAQYTSTSFLTRFLQTICNILTIVFMFKMVQTLYKFPASTPVKIVSLACLVIEVFNKIKIILGLLILTIVLPLLIVVLVLLCAASCCCSNRLMAIFPNLRLPQRQEPFDIVNHPALQSIQYSAQVVGQADNECKICFQNFAIGDRIIILPCNRKHVFHEFCISTWFNVAQTCPLCRKTLSEMAISQPSA